MEKNINYLTLLLLLLSSSGLNIQSFYGHNGCLLWDHKVMYLNIVCSSIRLTVIPHLKKSKNYILFTHVTLGLATLVTKDNLDLMILQTSPQARATTPGLRIHLNPLGKGKSTKQNKTCKATKSRHSPNFAQHACVSAGFRNSNQSSSCRKVGGGFFNPTGCGQSRPPGSTVSLAGD